MKLIIDISEEDYRECKFRKDLLSLGEEPTDLTFNMRMETLIANGTLLPEGHGRLIDADKVKEELKEHHDFFVNAYGSYKDMTFKEKARVDEITSSIATIVNAPTIIEADKGE